MVTLKLDWKFLLTTALAIVGIASPAWYDLNSKALMFRVISATSLAPATQVEGFQMSVSGREVTKPYLSTLQFENTGTKPILASEIEKPIEISVIGEATIVRAEISSVVPGNLPASIEVSDKRVSVSPILLNPGDSIAISILTTGALPGFQPSTRIVGIAQVSRETGLLRARTGWVSPLYLAVMAFSLTTMYAYHGISALASRKVPKRIVSICTAIPLGAASGVYIHRFLRSIYVDSNILYAECITIFFFLSMAYFRFAFRRNRTSGPPLNG